MDRHSLGSRLILLVLGLCAGAGLAELILRLGSPTLPSLAAAQGAAWAQRSSAFIDDPRPVLNQIPAERCQRSRTLSASTTTRYAGTQPPALLWVAGDSFAAGAGAPPQQGFAWRDAEALAQRTSRAVELRNFGQPGAGFCQAIRTAQQALVQPAKPDLLLLQFFADDLETHAMIATGEGTILFPDSASSRLGRALVNHSYLANLAWFSTSLVHGVPPRRFIDGPSQDWFVAAMKQLAANLQQADIGLVVTLLAPTGLDLCPTPARPNTRCAHLGQDMVLIGALLDRAGVPFVDLRTLWPGGGAMVSEHELGAVRAGQLEAAIHPDAAGHQAIADALMPALEAALATALAAGRDTPGTAQD